MLNASREQEDTCVPSENFILIFQTLISCPRGNTGFESRLLGCTIFTVRAGASLILKTLKNSTREALLKALNHLEYSYQKILKNELVKKSEWSEEELETLESFSSRFARSSDIFLSKYLRTLALETDPAFRGTFIDTLNLAEKMNWISSARQWTRIRELRNVAAHEYTQEDLQSLFQELIDLAPLVLSIRAIL